MCIPAHCPWLPGYTDVAQTLLIILTMVGLFPDRPHISKETQNTNMKEYMHPYVHCKVINNSQDLETAQVPMSR